MCLPYAQYKIVSLHYFEFAKDFIYDGENHDFGEFLYVDKGEVEVMADTSGYKLKLGDIIFHKPNEFHSLWANKIIAPNLILITFECNSKVMEFFKNKILNLGDHERNCLAIIIKEGYNTFLPPFDMPKVNMLNKKTNPPFGSEQLIKINLESLMIILVRRGTPAVSESRLSSFLLTIHQDRVLLLNHFHCHQHYKCSEGCHLKFDKRTCRNTC